MVFSQTDARSATRFSIPPHLLILSGILLAGFLLRIWNVTQYQYNSDEMQFVVMIKAGTLGEVWRRSLAELHPPLDHFLRHSLLFAVKDIYAQRYLSILAGLLAMCGMYRLGEQLQGKCAGLFCALCMAFSPVAVSSSATIRNYALFMAFLTWAILFFVRYQSNEQKSDLLRFALLLLLASATHFTGFFVAAACCISECRRQVRHKRWKRFTVFCLLYLPFAVLALVFYHFYLAPGTSGPMWQHYVEVMGIQGEAVGGFTMTAIKLFAYFMPFLGLIPQKLQDSSLFSAAWLAGTAWLMILYLQGLRVMRKKTPDAFALIVMAWIVTLAASLASIYPFSPTRHSYFMLPFYIVPYAYVLGPLARPLLQRNAACCGAAVIFGVAAWLAESGSYLKYEDEFVLKRKDYADSQTYLRSRLAPADGIVTGLFAYPYLADARDNGITPYDDYAGFSFHGAQVLPPDSPPFNPDRSWHSFYDSLDKYEHQITAQHKLWFVMYGWQTTQIIRLLQCNVIQGHISDRFMRQGVAIFSISSPAMDALLKDKAAWSACYAHYDPVSFAKPFGTL